MKHIAAVLLLALANKEINEKNINEVLASVGVKPNAECVKLLVTACKGKKPEQLIKEGASKLVPVAMGASGAAHEEHHDDKKGGKKDDKKGGKKEEKKPAKKEEPEEDDDMDIGGLF